MLRLAIANIHRPGALTPSVMLSLGLGLALLVTVVEIDGNLHRELADALPDKAPSFFFLDIPAADADRFDAFARDQAPGSTVERVPMLRGRIVAANGVPADGSQAGRRIALGAARRPRHHLRHRRPGRFAHRRRPVVERRLFRRSRWCRSRTGRRRISNLKIGDTVTVNVLGRNITARIANLRAVDWENLGINFVLVFSPGTFDGAPHSDIATLTFADGGTTAEETALIKALADAFPTVTAVRVKDALDAVGGHRRQARAGGARREFDHARSPPPWCSAARSPRASVSASTTPWCSRRWGRRARG